MKWKYIKYLIPNILSFARMVAVFPIWWAIDQDDYSTAFWVYVVALITDWLDGKTAKWFDAVTDIGKLLDPLADKVLHLFLLYQFQKLYPQLFVPVVFVTIFAVVLAGLPGFAKLFHIPRRLGSNWFGRRKMFTEGVAISLLFLRQPSLSSMFLWLAILLAIGSIIGHLAIKEDKDYHWFVRWLMRIKERKNQ